jgi:hypothetical protein
LKELVVTLDANWGCDLDQTAPWLLEPMRKLKVDEFRAVVVCEVYLDEVARGLAMILFTLEGFSPVKRIYAD